MRRALIGTLAGWLASATCLLAQTPRYFPADGPPSAPPDRASAGSMLTPYGRYNQASQVDTCRCEDQRNQANYRSNNTVTPAVAGPVMMNSNGQGPTYGNPNVMNGNGNNGPMINAKAVYSPAMVDGNGNYGPGTTNGTYQATPLTSGQMLQATGRNYRGGRAAYAPTSESDQGCGDCKTCQGSCPCGPPGQFWFSGELLLWWSSGMGVPPLLTTSPPGTPLNTPSLTGGPIPVAGVLGMSSTSVLFGGGDTNNGVRVGARLRAGVWLDNNNMCGLEGSFFFLGNQAQSFTSVSTANGIVMRPFFNTSTGRQDAEIVNFPGILSGTATVDTRNDVYGADANLRRNLLCTCNWRVDFLAGYRFMSVYDRLNISETLTTTGTNGPTPAGTVILVNDRFATNNQFHGGQLGLAGEWRVGRLFADWRGLVALGPSIKHVYINGTTTIIAPNSAPVVNTGGLLAQPTNIGTYYSSDFSVLPELGINVGVQACACIRLWVGYSFLYWSNVVRAGNQIDFAVNSTQIPPGILVGTPNPAFHMNRSDYWLQGVSFGAQIRF